MKQIGVSIDVYAAIWAARRPGENDENAILERILDVEVEDDEALHAGIGYCDPRHGVVIGEGQEIRRTYKGQEYRAVARGNAWQMNGQIYDSLNKLSRAVTGKTENAWVNWYIHTAGQPRILIESLRGREPADKARIVESVSYGDYEIKQYENGTIIIDQDGEYAGAARPILREIAAELNVSILNSRGRQFNTRQLGAEVIRALSI